MECPCLIWTEFPDYSVNVGAMAWLLAEQAERCFNVGRNTQHCYVCPCFIQKFSDIFTSPSMHLQSCGFLQKCGPDPFHVSNDSYYTLLRGMNCSNWCKLGSIVFPMKRTTLELCFLTSDVPLPQFGRSCSNHSANYFIASGIFSYHLLSYFLSEQGRNQVWPSIVWRICDSMS